MFTDTHHLTSQHTSPQNGFDILGSSHSPKEKTKGKRSKDEPVKKEKKEKKESKDKGDKKEEKEEKQAPPTVVPGDFRQKV